MFSLEPLYQKISEQLLETVSKIPASKVTASGSTSEQIEQIITTAARKSGAISGVLSLPSGPMAIATLLPDVVAIWKIQSQMVADIAQVSGKSDKLTRESMLFCLFQHGQSGMQDIVVRIGERYVVRKSSQKVFESFLGKIGLRLGRSLLGESLVRWLPVVGAIVVARYSHFDTQKVGATAREFFQQEIEIQ